VSSIKNAFLKLRFLEIPAPLPAKLCGYKVNLIVYFHSPAFYGIISPNMAFPSHLPDQIYEFAARVKDTVYPLFHKAVEKGTELGKQLLEKLPPEKRKPVLMTSIGACAVLVLIFAGIPLLTRDKPDERKPAASPAGNAPARQGIIPPDELFLPNEPDFIPGVMLEREQRTVWTAADAAPLWQDPLKNGEEPWRNRIEKTIDEIMESVP